MGFACVFTRAHAPVCVSVCVCASICLHASLFLSVQRFEQNEDINDRSSDAIAMQTSVTAAFR